MDVQLRSDTWGYVTPSRRLCAVILDAGLPYGRSGLYADSRTIYDLMMSGF